MVERDQGETTTHRLQGLAQGLGDGRGLRAPGKLGNDLAVRLSGERCAVAFQGGAQLGYVRELAVVRDGEAA